MHKSLKISEKIFGQVLAVVLGKKIIEGCIPKSFFPSWLKKVFGNKLFLKSLLFLIRKIFNSNSFH